MILAQTCTTGGVKWHYSHHIPSLSEIKRQYPVINEPKTRPASKNERYYLKLNMALLI